VKEGCIPEDWKSSVVLPFNKGNGDPMECGSYIGIKFLEHAMKVAERLGMSTEGMSFRVGYIFDQGVDQRGLGEYEVEGTRPRDRLRGLGERLRRKTVKCYG